MPGTDSNSGRCSLLYHSLNSSTCWASISTYTMKIPRPFCAIGPSPLWSVAAILLTLLVGSRSSRLETRRDTRHQLGGQAIITLTQQIDRPIFRSTLTGAGDAQGQRTQQQDVSGRSQGAR